MLIVAFIYTNDRFCWVIFLLIDIQDSFHLTNKGSVLLRRNFPLLLQPRLDDFFLSTLPIVEEEISSITSRVTTRSRIRFRLHLAYPFGAAEQAIMVMWASTAPSTILGRPLLGLSKRVASIRCVWEKRLRR